MDTLKYVISKSPQDVAKFELKQWPTRLRTLAAQVGIKRLCFNQVFKTQGIDRQLLEKITLDSLKHLNPKWTLNMLDDLPRKLTQLATKIPQHLKKSYGEGKIDVCSLIYKTGGNRPPHIDN